MENFVLIAILILAVYNTAIYYESWKRKKQSTEACDDCQFEMERRTHEAQRTAYSRGYTAGAGSILTAHKQSLEMEGGYDFEAWGKSLMQVEAETWVLVDPDACEYAGPFLTVQGAVSYDPSIQSINRRQYREEYAENR